jgi:regulator of protease activity HflC (stomatin/prohibitin superfamily)
MARLAIPHPRDEDDRRSSGFPIFRTILVVFAVLFAVSMFLGSWFQVSQNERTVVDTWGKFSYVASPGLNFKVPFMQGTHDYRVDIQDLTPDKPVNTYTVDNQEVDIMFNLFYRVPEDKIQYLFTNNRDYKARLFTMTLDRLKSEMGQVNVQIVAEKRGELRDRIFRVLKSSAEHLGVEVTDFQLTDLQYTKAFRDAVNNAAVAKANVESFEYQRQQAEKQAMTDKVKAEGLANGARETARGEADANLLKAEAEAKAIRLKGEAQAAAIKAQSDALKENAALVELEKAKRWDGKLPTQMLGSAPIPFMNIPTNAHVVPVPAK